MCGIVVFCFARGGRTTVNQTFWKDFIGQLDFAGLPYLQVSERTLRRRRHELGYASAAPSFTNIDNSSLDEIVRDILQVTPRVGFRLVQGALRQRGITVQRRRILEALRRVDPVMITLREKPFESSLTVS